MVGGLVGVLRTAAWCGGCHQPPYLTSTLGRPAGDPSEGPLYPQMPPGELGCTSVAGTEPEEGSSKSMELGLKAMTKEMLWWDMGAGATVVEAGADALADVDVVFDVDFFLFSPSSKGRSCY